MFSDEEEDGQGDQGGSQDNCIVPTMICPPKNFQEKKRDVWVEDTPGSERAARPLVTAMQRETRGNIETLVNN